MRISTAASDRPLFRRSTPALSVSVQGPHGWHELLDRPLPAVGDRPEQGLIDLRGRRAALPHSLQDARRASMHVRLGLGTNYSLTGVVCREYNLSKSTAGPKASGVSPCGRPTLGNSSREAK